MKNPFGEWPGFEDFDYEYWEKTKRAEELEPWARCARKEGGWPPYVIKVTGGKRSAEFTMDMNQRQIVRTKLHLSSGAEKGNGEFLSLKIYKDFNGVLIGPGQEEKWMVLWGTIDNILDSIEAEWPMVKMESDALFKAIKEDEDGGKGNVFYTYRLLGPRSSTPDWVREELILNQAAIVGSMWEVDPQYIKVLRAKNSWQHYTAED